MKKIIYSLFAPAALLLSLSSCGGHEEYDTYVGVLKAQPAVIDTISSPASYAVYLDSLSVKARAFDELGLKLDPTQKEELETLSLQIQQALTDKYNRMAQEPMPIEAVLDSSAPVEAFSQSGQEVEL